ncbi:MAG: thiamine ABC transporter substrate-binding protein [Bifidobacteriaceae bacterium]|jgi:thiamine transport system substrate-binding protein|nr:thiamine ABC transporter substrate-binding protein [Bifidobacteriaceae bacterium]
MTRLTSARAGRGAGPRALAAATALAAAVTLAACGQAGGSAGGNSAGAGQTATAARIVKLVTHGSFSLSDAALARFAEETGLELEILPADDAGAMVNQLILTKEAPLGDVVFGVDNTFASRAVAEDLFEPYSSPGAGPEQAEHAVGLEGKLTAVDFSDVCLNADRRVIADAAGLTLDDLVKPEFKDRLVVENPATSSPGLAFLLTTIAARGEDGYLDYWRQLKDNGLKVVSGWNEAYYDEFSGPSSAGERPLVVSYASSPPSEIPADATEPATVAALETCFRQVEYAGVLKGAANPAGAREVVDFLLSDAVQADIPSQMWVYPVKPDTPLPEEWAKWAPLSARPWTLSPAEIAAGRERWIAEFTDQILG